MSINQKGIYNTLTTFAKLTVGYASVILICLPGIFTYIISNLSEELNIELFKNYEKITIIPVIIMILLIEILNKKIIIKIFFVCWFLFGIINIGVIYYYTNIGTVVDVLIRCIKISLAVGMVCSIFQFFYERYNPHKK